MKVWLIFAFCFNLILGLEVKNSGNPLLFESVEQHTIDVAKTLIGGGDAAAPIRTVRGYKSKLIKQRKETEKKAAEEAAKKEAEEKAKLEAEARAEGEFETKIDKLAKVEYLSGKGKKDPSSIIKATNENKIWISKELGHNLSF